MPTGRIKASICVTDLVNMIKAGHSAGNIGKNGKVYANVTVWINDEERHGNDCGFQLNSTKDGEAKDKTLNGGKATYIGNGKITLDGVTGGGVPANAMAGLDLPGGGAVPQQNAAVQQANNDLPF